MQLGFLAGPTVILQKTDQSRKTDGNNSSDHLGWTLVPKVQFGEKGESNHANACLISSKRRSMDTEGNIMITEVCVLGLVLLVFWVYFTVNFVVMRNYIVVISSGCLSPWETRS